jgi:molybdopterin converting factor small subunit
VNLRVVAFASAAETLGRAELRLELAAGARVTELREFLLARHPDLAPLWSRLAIAVDGRVVGADEPLVEGAEVALLPPVSGG